MSGGPSTASRQPRRLNTTSLVAGIVAGILLAASIALAGLTGTVIPFYFLATSVVFAERLASPRFAFFVAAANALGIIVFVVANSGLSALAVVFPLALLVLVTVLVVMVSRSGRLRVGLSGLSADEYRAELAHMVVHDLRSPLTSIVTAMHLAQDIIAQQAPELEDLHATIETSRNSGDSLLRLVESLLDIHKLENSRLPLDLKPFSPASVAREARDTLRSVSDMSGIQVSIDAPKAGAAVIADEEIIRRVVINLLDNALRYSPPGGSIRIEVADTGGEHQVSVIDSGGGIPDEERERVFTRFTRLGEATGSSDAHGWGLGLTFCRLAVEAHGGRIWVENVPDAGAAFHFTLPHRGEVG